jgi:hypothetical protein
VVTILYPITPEYLAAVPDRLVRLYEDLDDYIIADICKRFKLSGEASETALELIRQLQRRGYDLQDIEEEIQRVEGIAQTQLDEMFDAAVERNQIYFDYMIGKADIAVDSFKLDEMAAEITAIREQTLGEFQNLTRSMGFAIRGADGSVQFLPVAETYQKVLDKAEMKVWSGAVDYNTAIREAVKELTDSGLQTIDYASGWHNRVDVATRRAVMSGVSSISAKYSESLGGILDTNYVEVTAHIGARNTGDGIENHEAWQGQVYYWSKSGEKDPLGKYADFIQSTGYGEGAGLAGWNCRHHFNPFVPGVSEPTYTQAELDAMKAENRPKVEYEGREYDSYQATQQMRKIETAMRACKRKIIGYEAAGQTDQENAYRARLLALRQKYSAFSEAAGLRKQQERANVRP